MVRRLGKVSLGVARLSATLPARPVSRGVPVGTCTPPTGLPVLLRLPSSMHNSAITPAGTARCLCRFSSRTAFCLPLVAGGSAPALHVSGPAQRSLVFRPECSLNYSSQSFVTRVLELMSFSMTRPGCHQAKATIVGWGSHPLGRRAFPRRAAASRLGGIDQ